jgi:hypothetical protein
VFYLGRVYNSGMLAGELDIIRFLVMLCEVWFDTLVELIYRVREERTNMHYIANI